MTPTNFSARAFQIFKSGQHTAVDGKQFSFTPTDLGAIAAGYDSQRNPAPLVLGHPDGAAPAFGKVGALIAHQDSLFAVADVSPDLIQWVRDGRYRNVSASFFQPGAANNPTPSSYHLRHVGFLGAVPPAVKNMQRIAFAEPVPIADAIASFAAPPGAEVDAERMLVYRLATDLMDALPSLNFSEAATLAEQALFTAGDF